MSGGRWEYCGSRIQISLETIALDPKVEERFPKLSTVLLELGEALYQIEHALDWDLSADSAITDDREFESNFAIKRLQKAVESLEKS